MEEIKRDAPAVLTLFITHIPWALLPPINHVPGFQLHVRTLAVVCANDHGMDRTYLLVAGNKGVAGQ
ncbi:hypothetical protein D3C77_455090 [compost metagenome]